MTNCTVKRLSGLQFETHTLTLRWGSEGGFGVRNVENRLSLFPSWPVWKQKSLQRSTRTPLVSSEAVGALQNRCAMRGVALTPSCCWQWCVAGLCWEGFWQGFGSTSLRITLNIVLSVLADPSSLFLSQESLHSIPGGDGRGLRLRAAGAGAEACAGPARQRGGAGLPPVHPL